MSFYVKNIILSNKLKLSLNNLIRCNSTQKGIQLIFENYGDPLKVLQKQEFNLKDPASDEVVVEMLAAPINPADINVIQGKYPMFNIQLPLVPGMEGVGKIIATGKSVENFQIGDYVIPLVPTIGTWKTHAILNSNLLYQVPKEIGLVEAATLTINPTTAYRMLEDFIQLNAGDTVIQNGANSAVGQNVIEICKSRKINTVNIVRDRPQIEELRNFLLNLGGTHVITENEIRNFKFGKKLEKPKLALNCVGGKYTLEMLRHMSYGGVMVTYGGMSRQPVIIPTSTLIFKNIKLFGFWVNKWSELHYNTEERWTMFENLINLIKRGELNAPLHKLIPFDDYQQAIKNTVSASGFIGQKYVLDFNTLKA